MTTITNSYKGDSLEMGRRVYRLRMAHSLTQEELAEAINVSSGSVRNWETGKYRPRLKPMRRLAVYFGVTTEWLRYGEDGQSTGGHTDIMWPWNI